MKKKSFFRANYNVLFFLFIIRMFWCDVDFCHVNTGIFFYLIRDYGLEMAQKLCSIQSNVNILFAISSINQSTDANSFSPVTALTPTTLQ